MASLTSGPLTGGSSVSALVKSASTLANELATYSDDEAAITYEFSAKSDSDLATYQSYLNGRITQLNGTGTVTDATKALTLQKDSMEAINSNITASIQAENIQVMAGNATPTDKLNLIESEFNKALSIGDDSTAQTLESQAYSLQQTIEVDAQNAATASSALSAAGASQEDNVATQLTDQLDQLNKDAGAAGQANLNAQLKTWVGNNKTSLMALANGPNIDPNAKAAIENAINTSQPNYADVVAGVGQAIISAHYLAYQEELPIDPETAQGYLDSANNIANGTTTIKTLAGSLSMQQIQEWQSNPAMFAPHENANTGTLEFTFDSSGKANNTTSINGLKFDQSGNVIANFTGSDEAQELTSTQAGTVNKTLTKLGFNASSATDATSMNNGITVQATDKVPKWLQPILAGQQNATLQAYVTKQGIVLGTINQQGKGQIYLIASDSSGKNAVYKATGQYSNGNPIFGQQEAAGDNGFNQKNNSLVVASSQGAGNVLSTSGEPIGGAQLKGTLLNETGGTANAESNLVNGNVFTLQQLINGSQAKVQQMTIARQQAAAATAAKSQSLFGATSIAAPNAPQIPVAAPTPKAVNEPTVNPQPASAKSTQILQPTVSGSSIQGNSTSIQGSGSSSGGVNINQSGSAGIKL